MNFKKILIKRVEEENKKPDVKEVEAHEEQRLSAEIIPTLPSVSDSEEKETPDGSSNSLLTERTSKVFQSDNKVKGHGSRDSTYEAKNDNKKSYYKKWRAKLKESEEQQIENACKGNNSEVGDSLSDIVVQSHKENANRQ
ncbi:hypothetical protein Bhyg_04730 [Pseudolycoriella hygida]|uniref:Uncharacterized protein n=1 Tax=Pseudolycoriella hygida TaxID=35572 RepID=A0A9Q0S8L3_9DIPT|nr:hypothetical protein Bhyg_04730 [Pseudolycoriella hygida]